MTTHLVDDHHSVTLGILAGGAATRLGGLDKAWLERDGVPQVVSLADTMTDQVDAVLVSANRNAERYMSHGLRAIHDRHAGIGPLGGLHALVSECRSEWLLTLPVDALSVPDDLIARLTEACTEASGGSVAIDDDGRQPLVALWRIDALHVAIDTAIASGDFAMHALQTQLSMIDVRFDGVRIGNINTPRDAEAAGIVL